MTRKLLFFLFLAPLGMMTPIQAATYYIGDAASAKQNIQPGARQSADSVVSLTYAFVNAGATYTNQTGNIQSLRFTEINFISDEGDGILIPFLAKYQGGNYSQGNSYTLFSIGDTITPPPGIYGNGGTLVNTTFTVDGSFPTFDILPGETVVAGFHQSSRIVLVDETNQFMNDYIANNNTIPNALGFTLTSNSQYTLDRTILYNVGFEIVPEPTRALLLLSALSASIMMRKRSGISLSSTR